MTLVRIYCHRTANGALISRSPGTIHFRPCAPVRRLLVIFDCLILAAAAFGQNAVTESVPQPSELKPQPDGTILVPSSDKTGKRTEALILTPLKPQERFLPGSTAPQTNQTLSASAPKIVLEESALALQLALARHG